MLTCGEVHAIGNLNLADIVSLPVSCLVQLRGLLTLTLVEISSATIRP